MCKNIKIYFWLEYKRKMSPRQNKQHPYIPVRIPQRFHDPLNPHDYAKTPFQQQSSGITRGMYEANPRGPTGGQLYYNRLSSCKSFWWTISISV